MIWNGHEVKVGQIWEYPGYRCICRLKVIDFKSNTENTVTITNMYADPPFTTYTEVNWPFCPSIVATLVHDPVSDVTGPTGFSISEDVPVKDIVNPIHRPDVPFRQEDIERAWQVLKDMCK